MERRNVSNFSMLFCIIILLFVFQPPIQMIIGPFQYWDELYSILIVPLFVKYLYEHDYRITLKLSSVAIIFLLLLFSVCGGLGSVIQHFQPMRYVLLDWFLHMKFFCGIAVTYMLFYDKNLSTIYTTFWPWLKSLVIFICSVVFVDLIFHIFPATYRMGLRSEGIFYGHPTNLAAVCFLLLAFLFRMYQYVGIGIYPYLCMIGFVILTTMRAKAWGGLVFAIVIFFIIVKQKKDFGALTWMACLAGAFAVAVKQLQSYYLMDNLKEVRMILTRLSLRIAKDYFPFGTGFASFGSAYSARPYSRVYYLYHVNRIWGMSPKEPKFISDTFWPMILGQSGYVGFLLYVLIVVILFFRISEFRHVNAFTYASGLVGFVYLIISSTSESSFVNPMAVPLSIIIGLGFVEISGRQQSEYYMYDSLTKRKKEVHINEK